MSDDAEKNRLKHEEANQRALKEAQKDLGHKQAAEETDNRAKGTKAEIDHRDGIDHGKNRS